MSSDRLRIVHVLRAPVGGLFRHVIDLAAAQRARGHEVGVFFDTSARDARVEAALERGGFSLGVSGATIPRHPGPSDLVAFAKFRRWLQRLRPDVIHGHGAKGGLYARCARWLAPPGRPIAAYTPHGGSFDERAGSARHRFYMAVERALAPATDLFLFESAYIGSRCDLYVGVAAGVRRVVRNGLDEREFAPIAPDANAADLVYVGELRDIKGVDTLIDALQRMAPVDGRAAGLAVVGSGPQDAELKALVARAGLAARVKFHGPLPARQAFRLGRVFVMPSRRESLPYVILEAAAAGVPLVTTSVGGIPEIFGPFRDRLGPAGDAADLARRLDGMFASSPRARAEDARALRDYVGAHFSISAMADGVLSGYREALGRRRAWQDVQPARAAPRCR